MIYVTVRQPAPRDEAMSGGVSGCARNSATRTYELSSVSERLLRTLDVAALIRTLEAFNRDTRRLHERPRQELYRTFYIPKKSGGLRRIDAPNPELMGALRRLKHIFEQDFHALYHTSAFAYVPNRGTVDCLKRHQANESKWFAKFDLHDFFGSTTPQFVMRMLGMIFPFSEVMKLEAGRSALERALDLAFLNGGLPQGTPFSPLITNVMMIPIDFKLANGLRDFELQRFVYTRYADDFQVSSQYEFSFAYVEKCISVVLEEFGAPFHINKSKTRYGSSSGANWNLGLMLNRDNNITIGNKRKRQFQAMLASYIMDRKNGIPWDKADIQTMEGYRSYYCMVEGDTIQRIIAHINEKFQVDVVSMIRDDLKL